MHIANIRALEILDSRGNPTVMARVNLEDGTKGYASVPSGASTGSHEALELRDNDEKRYLGKGVLKAVDNVNTKIADALKGIEIEDLLNIDKIMLNLDGTDNKSQLGANAILAVSLASARALANAKKEPVWKTLHEYFFSEFETAFPRLMVNIINGGAHANWIFDIQEFMILPKTTSPSESVKLASEVFHHLGKLLKDKGFHTLVGDEGGYAPILSSNKEAFEYIHMAIKNAGYIAGQNVDLGIDAAASEFYKNGQYQMRVENKNLQMTELVTYYLDLVKKFGIVSIEDPFAEDDWEGFKLLTSKIDSGTVVIGDDLYVTNPQRIEKGISQKATNGVLIKVNQIGTLSETIEAIKKTRSAGWKIAISNRSGETNDHFIADLAVACGADFIKTGSMSRSERLSKYNRLIEIEQLEM